MVNKTTEKKQKEGTKTERGYIIISKKMAHKMLQTILDYTLDIAQKSLETKDKTLRDILNSKMRDTLDLSIYLTNRLYKPSLKRTKQKEVVICSI